MWYFSSFQTISDAIEEEDSGSDSYSDPPSLDPITPFDTDTFNITNVLKVQAIVLDDSLNKQQTIDKVPEEASKSGSIGDEAGVSLEDPSNELPPFDLDEIVIIGEKMRRPKGRFYLYIAQLS